MVTIKQAMESALLFAADTLGVERARGARLEEVDSTAYTWSENLTARFCR